MSFAEVAIPKPLFNLFTYKIPKNLEGKIRIGSRVVIPLRNKPMIGFCCNLLEKMPEGLSETKIKEIAEIKEEEPIFSKAMMELILWLTNYYAAPIGEVCRTALPSRLTQIKAPTTAKPRIDEEFPQAFFQTESVQLIPEQKKALERILEIDGEKESKPILLHGITGAGKTEIYIQFAKQVLDNRKQVIFLVPEIGLTPQLLGRLQSRLDEKIAVYHSGQTDAWRQKTWQEIKEGKIRVALGTRSALFAPFANLGAIIVDEEHDSSYKQEDGSLRYHARDAAIVRGKLEKATVVLGSATPSLETVYNCKEGKYEYICLTKRPTGAKLPSVTTIDLRKEKFSTDSQTLSQPLQSAIAENLYRREQTLLLLNRRGFANFLLCEECGTATECPNCAISLTYHKTLRSLVCHYCEYKHGLPQTCGQCQSTDINLVGLGTQRLEEELNLLFPRAAISRLDQDTTAKREVRNQSLQKMKRGEIDILLGTQLVAKGHDFPNVTLVGVILADTTLHLPDFRSAERNFQLLTQVAGRSGRDQKPGRVLIQTFQPEHFSLACAQEHNFEKFYERELKTRRELNYPPFSRLAQIRIEGAREENVKQLANKIKNILPKSAELQILGPAKAPLAKIRGKFRWQILLKTKNRAALNACLQAIQPWRERSPIAATQIQIDVDCINTM